MNRTALYMRRLVGDPRNPTCTSCGGARIVRGSAIVCPPCDSSDLWPAKRS